MRGYLCWRRKSECCATAVRAGPYLLLTESRRPSERGGSGGFQRRDEALLRPQSSGLNARPCFVSDHGFGRRSAPMFSKARGSLDHLPCAWGLQISQAPRDLVGSERKPEPNPGCELGGWEWLHTGQLPVGQRAPHYQWLRKSGQLRRRPGRNVNEPGVRRAYFHAGLPST